MKNRIWATFVICLTLSLFSTFGQSLQQSNVVVEQVNPEISMIDVESEKSRIPVRGEKLDWGLALSGGGTRSAAFNIGVLKHLYDTGLLDEVDIISSVSGGGYASYWLFSNYARSPSSRFGETAFWGRPLHEEHM